MLPRFSKDSVLPVAKPDVKHIRRDMCDSLFLNARDEFQFAKGKIAVVWCQDNFLQMPLSSGHFLLKESQGSFLCEI